MKLLITGTLNSTFILRLIENLDNIDNYSEMQQVGYNDLIINIAKTIHNHPEIDEIYVVGFPSNFIEGVGEQIQNSFPKISVSMLEITEE